MTTLKFGDRVLILRGSMAGSIGTAICPSRYLLGYWRVHIPKAGLFYFPEKNLFSETEGAQIFGALGELG